MMFRIVAGESSRTFFWATMPEETGLPIFR